MLGEAATATATRKQSAANNAVRSSGLMVLLPFPVIIMSFSANRFLMSRFLGLTSGRKYPLMTVEKHGGPPKRTSVQVASIVEDRGGCREIQAAQHRLGLTAPA